MRLVVGAVGCNVEGHSAVAGNAVFFRALRVVGKGERTGARALSAKLRAHLGDSIEVDVEAIVLVAGERPEAWRVHRSEVQEESPCRA